MNRTNGKGRRMGKWVSGALFAAMLLYPMPLAAAGSDGGRCYVALGDSISSGYGLKEEEQMFTQQVANQNDFQLTSLAQNGETSETLLQRLNDPEAAASVAQADVITITIGGNDLMNALYAYLFHQYQEKNPDATIKQEDIKAAMMGGDMTMLAFALDVAPGFADSQEEKDALALFVSNLTQVVTAIRSVNPQVCLVLTNQYDPYSHLVKELSKYPLVSDVAEQISCAFSTGVSTLNSAIASVGALMGCSVVDVYTAFADAQENPCNAGMSAAMKLNLDFHPNAYGHSLIAQAVTAAANAQLGTGARTVSGQTTDLIQGEDKAGQEIWLVAAGTAGACLVAVVTVWRGRRCGGWKR